MKIPLKFFLDHHFLFQSSSDDYPAHCVDVLNASFAKNVLFLRRATDEDKKSEEDWKQK